MNKQYLVSKEEFKQQACKDCRLVERLFTDKTPVSTLSEEKILEIVGVCCKKIVKACYYKTEKKEVTDVIDKSVNKAVSQLSNLIPIEKR